MLSEDSIKGIALMFCGDTQGYFNYKRGADLVKFFNQYFGYKDIYQAGFPSRWIYTYDKLVDFVNSNRIDSFINLILSKEYLLIERKSTEVEVLTHVKLIFNEFNRLLKPNLYNITQKGGKYYITEENEDLEYIGGGGFANVYKQRSTGLIVKKLKEDYLTDNGLRSRFKREYNITKSLSDLERIIKVYEFDEGSCFYTMEKAETTLREYILNSSITNEMKIICIRQILDIMTEVHKRDIIHRDISPTNIFVLNGILKIADFGLGKDLNMFTSHQTIHTNGVGQYYYCAPEQFMMLKEGDKRSDVYSLGRLINFIMTADPNNSHHFFRSVTEKATNQNVVYRYSDAGQLLNYVEKSIKYHEKELNKEKINMKIIQNILDDEIESYIYEMSSEDICKALLDEQHGFSTTLIKFMKKDDKHAFHIIQSVEDSYKETCGRTFKAYDPFATFAFAVLNEKFPFIVNELAANILRYVAFDVNRFDAQALVERLKKKGLEPLIEEVLAM